MMLVLSLSKHKETRFMLVIIPFLLLLSIKGFKRVENIRLLMFTFFCFNLFGFVTNTFTLKMGGTYILRDLRA